MFSIDFSSWSRNKEELVEFSASMFEEVGISKEFNIQHETLVAYMTTVQTFYRDNPFHSFYHAVTVAQMIFLMIAQTELKNFLSPIEKFSLLIAAISHDLDHPGLNNRFQINSKSELALQYDNKSVLENHHLSTCLKLLREHPSGQQLLSGMTESQKSTIYEKVTIMILATDMEMHFTYKQKFDELVPNFSWDNPEHRDLLFIMLLKSADISNELRSFDISNRWANALLEEFFAQSDLEKEKNLPLTPFMLREKVVLNSTQVNFIDKFLLPSYQSLQILLPSLSVYVERINQNRNTWLSTE